MVRDALLAALLTMRMTRLHSLRVITGHSRSKNGILKDAYDPVIHDASPDCSAFRKPAIVERPHGSPGQARR
jgi:hypothetical protein